MQNKLLQWSGVKTRNQMVCQLPPPTEPGRSAVRTVNDTTEYVPTWPPNWTNAPSDGWRLYWLYGDAVLTQTKDILKCSVSSSAITFLFRFSPICMVFHWIIIWFVTPVQSDRILFVIFHAFCAVAGFGLIYAFLKHHRDLGDYVVVGLSDRRVNLPRHHRTFDLEDIRGLQLLFGRDVSEDDVTNSELYLLVDEGGVITRYHVMGNPLKEHARLVARSMNTELFVQTVPSGWYRSSDRQNHAVNRSGESDGA